jgi:hypothetical protein
LGAFAQEEETYTEAELDSLVKLRADSLMRAWQATKSPPAAMPPEEKHWKYHLSLDGNWNKGNVQRQLLIARAEISWKNSVLDFTAHPRFVYGKQNGLLAERDGFSDLYVNVLHSRKLYGFGLGTIENSNLRSINVRYMGGGGIGCHFVRTENNRFSITNAIVYEATDFFAPNDKIETLRNSLRIKGSHRFGSKHFSLKYLSFFQPSLLNINNLRWSTQIWAEIFISKSLSFRATAENYYEGFVATNRKRNDSRLSVGFSFSSR